MSTSIDRRERPDLHRPTAWRNEGRGEGRQVRQQLQTMAACGPKSRHVLLSSHGRVSTMGRRLCCCCKPGAGYATINRLMMIKSIPVSSGHDGRNNDDNDNDNDDNDDDNDDNDDKDDDDNDNNDDDDSDNDKDGRNQWRNNVEKGERISRRSCRLRWSVSEGQSVGQAGGPTAQNREGSAKGTTMVDA
eukprot:GHVU01037311.1.p1 GENE.GHVU01037311.1~~GHVU01037311.1.p1  ORF type:complete len:189 (+),score=37.87 GHVU01037311.1:7-573(+)